MTEKQKTGGRRCSTTAPRKRLNSAKCWPSPFKCNRCDGWITGLLPGASKMWIRTHIDHFGNGMEAACHRVWGRNS
jgi:hypothetical protein